MSRRTSQLAGVLSLGAALLLAGCGSPALDSETAAGFQSTVRDIATAAAAGDQIGATQLASELSQSVAVAQGQGTVTSERAGQIQSTIEELLGSMIAEPDQSGNVAPVPEPTTPSPSNDDSQSDAEREFEEAQRDAEKDFEKARSDAEKELEKAQRDAEKELDKQQRDLEEAEAEQREEAEREQAEREQEQRDQAEREEEQREDADDEA